MCKHDFVRIPGFSLVDRWEGMLFFKWQHLFFTVCYSKEEKLAILHVNTFKRFISLGVFPEFPGQSPGVDNKRSSKDTLDLLQGTTRSFASQREAMIESHMSHILEFTVHKT